LVGGFCGAGATVGRCIAGVFGVGALGAGLLVLIWATLA
jgi:hypothetical protein